LAFPGGAASAQKCLEHQLLELHRCAANTYKSLKKGKRAPAPAINQAVHFGKRSWQGSFRDAVRASVNRVSASPLCPAEAGPGDRSRRT
jgi:hypothetical protein